MKQSTIPKLIKLRIVECFTNKKRKNIWPLMKLKKRLLKKFQK